MHGHFAYVYSAYVCARVHRTRLTAGGYRTYSLAIAGASYTADNALMLISTHVDSSNAMHTRTSELRIAEVHARTTLIEQTLRV